jgi:protein phosphatase/serine/threonine-protein phosphatase Stp1
VSGTLLKLAPFGSPAEPAPLRVADAACTDPGLLRPANEDAFVRRTEDRLWAVADGMGGHEGGAWAAAAIAHALSTAPVIGTLEADSAGAAHSLHDANRLIHSRAEALGLRMGSTVVALVLGGRRFSVLWAGDSRAYLLRDGRLAPLTRDHTQVQERVERGLLSPAEARKHPMAHVLTRAVGVQPELELASASGAAWPGDAFLLCSDGLHGVAADEEIAERLRARSPASACEALVALAVERGAPDNVTVVVVACAA